VNRINRCSHPVWAALIVAGVLSPTESLAQQTFEIPVQFDFVNPGAKSLALAGAFAGLADDATASFANPAGLTFLVTPELSGELRHSQVRPVSVQGGRLSGVVTDRGADILQGPNFFKEFQAHTGARYLAAVLPLASRQWVVSAYRHELARVDFRLDSSGVFQHDPSEAQSRRETPYTAERHVNITGYGASAAYKLRSTVALGAGLALYRFQLDTSFVEYDLPDFYAFADRSTGIKKQVQAGNDFGVAPTFGVTIDRGRMRVGAVYRHGGTFTFNSQESSEEPHEATFRVPHTLGVGVSARVSPKLLLSGEVTRITYSRLFADFVFEQRRLADDRASFFINDGTELHVSMQYAPGRQGGAPVRLRVGTWYDPDHNVRFERLREPTTADERLFDERFTAALSQNGPQTHVTGGVGLTLSKRIDFNAGVDVAHDSRQFSASVIVHAGKVLQ
jgi:long-chain fatty acid transport protein